MKYKRWYLCPETEHFFVDAMEQQAALKISYREKPLFLLKLNGRMTALCLEDFVTQEGKVFMKNNYYCLTDEESIAYVKAQFDEGNSFVSLVHPHFALMRQLSKENPGGEGLLTKARIYAESMPQSLPRTINGLSRSEYRVQVHDTQTKE